MPRRLYRMMQHPVGGKVLLALLIIVSLAYMIAVRRFLYPVVFAPSVTISEHQVSTSASATLQYWTVANMESAINDDLLSSSGSLSQQSDSINASSRQDGQRPGDGNSLYPLTTVGKIFFSDASGQDYVCSGTAIESSNQSVVDTAGHCLYWDGDWTRNVLFCPLYENGNTPYGCWAARDLEVPSDWIDRSPNDLHHDFGMAIVSPNFQGEKLTAVVGGAGWAYNQSVNQPFYAYGYPAAYPFDGQTRQSCEGATGTRWQYAGGTVISIPCNMTGGSSGGPWFIKINGNWYLDGHNDFTSTIKPGHMFSPYYDDTWYALYTKAQNS
ncbi:MAG TPA: hypothetical protein VKV19_15895 [Ktedonobacteraceae bacterium]|nr:hypothetical protein [Ktedonobacteraceae bacterium]